MKPITRWKFLDGNKSQSGNHKWIKNKWYKIKGDLELCRNGFHASKRIIDALGYVNTETLALVEVRGNYVEDPGNTKECWQEMRVLKTYKITKTQFVSMSIFSAELVIKYFEEQYPNDNRPREAIESAKTYIKNPTKENELIARSASSAAASASYAAWSAESASSAASSAARSASSAAASAAWTAESASYAAWSAESAASASSAAASASYAAWSTALNETKDKIELWILKNWVKEK